MPGAWLATDAEFADQFRGECVHTAAVTSPHVVPVHRYGEIDGRLYIDMALVRGGSLRDLLGGGPLSPERAVVIVAGVGRALDAARRAGIVHRDVKPSNILVSDDGDDHAYLIDFGIARCIDDARRTRSGTFIGTPTYMAPERFVGAGDHRSDIYALGCVLYESLTGMPPFPYRNMMTMVGAHQNVPPPCPSTWSGAVPTELDAVTARAMAKDPNQRYATAGDLVAAVCAVPSAVSEALPPAAARMADVGHPLFDATTTGDPLSAAP